jgi:hypothetical protein
MPPQRKAGAIFFERRFSVFKGFLDRFSKGIFGFFSGFSKGRGHGFSSDFWTGFLSDFGLWTV